METVKDILSMFSATREEFQTNAQNIMNEQVTALARLRIHAGDWVRAQEEALAAQLQLMKHRLAEEPTPHQDALRAMETRLLVDRAYKLLDASMAEVRTLQSRAWAAVIGYCNTPPAEGEEAP